MENKWPQTGRSQASLSNRAGNVRTNQHLAVEPKRDIFRKKILKRSSLSYVTLSHLLGKILWTNKSHFFNKIAACLDDLLCWRKTFLPFQHNLVPLILLLNNWLSFTNCLQISLLIRLLNVHCIDLCSAVTLTFVTEQTLSSIGAEAYSLQLRLWDACGSMTAGVALTGVELAQSACVERGALTEPVLSITKCGDRGRFH